MHAAQQGVLDLADSVRDHLGWEGPAGDATLGDLLTHTSGYRPDRTQRGLLGRWLHEPARIEAMIAKRATSERGDRAYFYNNENYLVLEAVLDAALDTPSVEWCLDEVPALRVMPSLGRADGYDAVGLAGGLAVSTPDLAAFMHALSPAADWPKAPAGDGAIYGPGIVMVDGRLIHRGAMCLLTGWGHAAIAARDSKGYAIAVTYTGCPDEAAEAALQAILDAAIRED